ncbi:putative CCT8-component of chaperonin-containing T-complex [Meira miltonrushii]|uniref:CCT-theta n=1 Tax=Meira miltonrushii TaxID=1280837 RepID=A0A316VDD1_9BASI|nr:putative CCT8-component of chaperonin-containing T-complex [Meira miltonrushii]PWN35334.1 putative CCT8-component of chaperonin-containing T-complex [Meira miltonrushii]
MSLRVPKAGMPLFKDGYKTMSGIEDAVLRNIQAVNELSDMVRTSFGPNGRNKMIVNHLERLFITSDAATIIRETEIVHPAAKLLVMASQQQEAEMGDATNLVLILAGELLKQAEPLINMGLHPSEIIQGYELARDRALKEIETLSVATLSNPPATDSLALALRPSIASKQYGQDEILAPLVAQAVNLVLPTSSSGSSNLKEFNVDNIRIVKIMGGSLSASRVVRGMIFAREPEGIIKRLPEGGKVAVFTCGLDISQTETKGTVLLHNAKELSTFSGGEEAQLSAIIKEIADSGVKVIVTQSSVGELALHYCNRYNIAVMKILSKFEIRRLCRLLGATPLARVGAPTPEEAGWIDVVETTEVGGDRVTVFRQEDGKPGGQARPKMATIVLRGATSNHLDDVERAIDDGVNVIKSLTKDDRLIPGAGASEVELARRIFDYGEKTSGLNQHAIKKFAEALEVVPRTLAENAGLDPTEVVGTLVARHASGQCADIGVDIEQKTSDSTISTTSEQVFDVLAAKLWAIRYAAGAAISVLNIDSIIMSKPAGIKAPQANPNWDDD